MITKNYIKKGEKLLNQLGIKTKHIESNQDIIEADNFSTILRDNPKK